MPPIYNTQPLQKRCGTYHTQEAAWLIQTVGAYEKGVKPEIMKNSLLVISLPHNLNWTSKSLQLDRKELSVLIWNTMCAHVCVTDGLYLRLRLYSAPAFYIPEGTNENESKFNKMNTFLPADIKYPKLIPHYIIVSPSSLPPRILKLVFFAFYCTQYTQYLILITSKGSYHIFILFSTKNTGLSLATMLLKRTIGSIHNTWHEDKRGSQIISKNNFFPTLQLRGVIIKAICQFMPNFNI